MPREFDEWEVEDAVRTLERAEEIKRDSSMMEKVEKKIKQKQVDLAKVDALLFGGSDIEGNLETDEVG